MMQRLERRIVEITWSAQEDRQAALSNLFIFMPCVHAVHAAACWFAAQGATHKTCCEQRMDRRWFVRAQAVWPASLRSICPNSNRGKPIMPEKLPLMRATSVAAAP